jgi:hypothetical protein
MRAGSDDGCRPPMADYLRIALLFTLWTFAHFDHS